MFRPVALQEKDLEVLGRSGISMVNASKTGIKCKISERTRSA
jgi:hypothetical protein